MQKTNLTEKQTKAYHQKIRLEKKMTKASPDKNLQETTAASEQTIPAWKKAQLSFKERADRISQDAVDKIPDIADAVTPQSHDITQNEITPCLPDDYYSGYPTDMTRCNPFFPINSNSIAETSSQYLQEHIIQAGNWGNLSFTGPKLSVYDEDVLVAILALLYEKSNHPLLKVIKDKKSGTESLTYTGSALKILKRMGKSNPGQNDYKRLISTLLRLQSATLSFNVSKGTLPNGEKKFSSYVTNILVGVSKYEYAEKKTLNFTISPFFYETFLRGAVTMLNATTRLKLRSPIARVLYRFVMSQKKDVAYKGSFLILSQALNMDQEQPAAQIRRLLTNAISILVKNNVLSKSSKFIDKNTVTLIKSRSGEKTNTKKNLSIDFSKDKPVEIELGVSHSTNLSFLHELE